MGNQTHHRLTGGPPNSEDFFWKEFRVIPLPFHIDASPKDATRRLHPIISRYSSKNRRILIPKDRSIGLIKCWKAGLKNLLVSTCITRRIRKRTIGDDEIGECQNSPYPLNDCTYFYVESQVPISQRESDIKRPMLLRTAPISKINLLLADIPFWIAAASFHILKAWARSLLSGRHHLIMSCK